MLEIKKDYHRFTKEGYKDGHMDSEKKMLEFLSRYENLVGNYDMLKVNKFLNDLGIETNYPIVVLSKKDHLDASTDLPTYLSISTDALGEVQRLSRVIIVTQNIEYEKENGGQLFTESIIVHELAHRDSLVYNVTTYAPDRRDISNRRAGFRVFNSGDPTRPFNNSILEEGFATFVGSRYLAQNWSVYPVSTIYPDPSVLIDIGNENGKYLTTPAGLHIDQKKLNSFESTSALGCIESLIYLDPEIENALYEARKSVDGLRKLIREIEKIQTGLYVKIRNTDYKNDSAVDELTTILINLMNAKNKGNLAGA